MFDIYRIIVIYLTILIFNNPIQATVLLNSSYDVSRELFLAINSNFIKK